MKKLLLLLVCIIVCEAVLAASSVDLITEDPYLGRYEMTPVSFLLTQALGYSGASTSRIVEFLETKSHEQWCDYIKNSTGSDYTKAKAYTSYYASEMPWISIANGPDSSGRYYVRISDGKEILDSNWRSILSDGTIAISGSYEDAPRLTRDRMFMVFLGSMILEKVIPNG
jgi:hypothetical protein